MAIIDLNYTDKEIYQKENQFDLLPRDSKIKIVASISKKISIIGIFSIIIINLIGYFFFGKISLVQFYITGFIIFLIFVINKTKNSIFYIEDRKKMFIETAVDLKLVYQEYGVKESLVGKLFSTDKAAEINHLFEGALKGFKVRLFDYYFTVGRRDKGGLSYQLFFCEIDCNKNLPSILITNKKNQHAMDDIRKIIATEGEDLSLEGNFSDFFSVRAEKGSDIFIRELLTPDIMLEMIEKYSGYSFMITDRKLYICCKSRQSALNSLDSLGSSESLSMITEKTEYLDHVKNCEYFISRWMPIVSRA